MRKRGLDQAEERINIRLHRPIEFDLLDLFNRIFAVLVCGVADEDVELAELVDRALDEVSAVLLAHQVAFDDDAFSAEVFDDPGEALPVSRFFLGFARCIVGHFADVRAGRERFFAGAGKDNPAHSAIVTGVVKDFIQFRDGVLVEGVEHLRPVDRHVRNCPLFLVQNIRARGRSGSGTHVNDS